MVLALSLPLAAQAKTARIHGIVLAVTPQTGEAIVRHDPFDGMPSMAMPFRVLPRARAAELLPGNEIDATADTGTEPWTLSNIAIVTTQAITAPGKSRFVPLRVGDTVPDTAFLDQSGRPFRFSMLRGQDVVLAFIYTRCQDPTMCPLISAHFNLLQRKLGSRAAHLVEVTLDPSYDRPPVLARYAGTFGADPRRWTLAVGDSQPTLDFAARFGVVVFPDASQGIIHSENTVEIGPDGVIRAMFPDATWQPDAILADIDASHAPDAGLLAHADDLGYGALALLIVGALGYLTFRVARGIARARLS
ncbi:MAG TPA: SCO family protein [Candidatus Lustribacter sp.]|nr:SCO family protein [Candidatus Lustribacter sp.]